MKKRTCIPGYTKQIQRWNEKAAALLSMGNANLSKVMFRACRDELKKRQTEIAANNARKSGAT